MKIPLVAAFTLAALSLPASLSAEIPPYITDADIVQGEPLIVVGRLRPESIEYMEEKAPDGVRRWQYHALLTVESVVRGSLEEVEIPLVIEYGIEPKVGGPHGLWREDYLQLTSEDRGKLKGQPISISGNRVGSSLLVSDAAENNLWFLRQVEIPGGGSRLGLKGAHDLQPLELRDYFMAYLSADPEAAVAEQVRRNPALAERAKELLDSGPVERAMKIQDSAERAEKLVSLYTTSAHRAAYQARKGVVDAGLAAGAALLRLFPTLDPEQDWRMREDVLKLLGEIGCREAVPLFLEILTEQERFWSREELQPEWWNDVEDERTAERRLRYGIALSTVHALRGLGDPRAREAMERTLQLWERPNSETFQIAEQCRLYLQALANQEARD